jgi:hypothetical protein
MYPIVCRWHTTHCEECGSCRAFDHAVKKELASFTTPPSSHIAVVAPRVREWIESLFPEADE